MNKAGENTFQWHPWKGSASILITIRMPHTTPGDFVLKKPPISWDSALFVGNGSHGAMCWMEGENLRLEVNHTQLYHRRKGRSMEDLARLPLGYVTIKSIIPHHFRLRLREAEIFIECNDGRSIRIRAQADAPILIIEDSEAGGRYKWRPHPSIVSTDRSRNTANPPSQNLTMDGFLVHQQSLIDGGGFVFVRESVTDAQSTRHYMSFAIDYADADNALQQGIRNITTEWERSPAQSQQDHQSWWKTFFSKSQLELPDEALNAFCWRQHYKLGSAVRCDGPAMDLFGPWYRDARWTQYFWNLNVQLNYFPTCVSGHADLIQSLADMLIHNQKALRSNVPEKERAPDRMQISGTTGIDCRGRHNDEMGNLLWICHTIWEWYSYTEDLSILDRYLLPILIPTVNHHLCRTRTDVDGMHTGPASSPEYGDTHRAIAEDCSYELELLRWACQTLIQIHELRDLSHPLLPVWQTVVGSLVSPHTDERGIMVAKHVSFDRSHRHWSHLIGFYPLYLYDLDAAQHRQCLKQSLHNWLELDQHLAGYSHAGAAAMLAALEKGDEALLQLKELIASQLTVNTMYLEPCKPFDPHQPDPDGADRLSPTLETPLAAWRAIMDMLLCSRNDRVYLFNGIPSSWQEARFNGLCAPGQLRFDAELSQRRLSSVQITGPLSRQITLVCPHAHFPAMKPVNVIVDDISEHRLTFRLSAQIGSLAL